VEATVTTTLWDTTGGDVVKALVAERRAGGAVASGLAVTLVAIVDEKNVVTAEQAATIAAQAHPCRLLIVIRRQVDTSDRLDAEVQVVGNSGRTSRRARCASARSPQRRSNSTVRKGATLNPRRKQESNGSGRSPR